MLAVHLRCKVKIWIPFKICTCSFWRQCDKRSVLFECLFINPRPAGSHSELRVTLFAWRSGSSLTCIWVEFAPPQTGSWGTDPGQSCSPPEPASGPTASTWGAEQEEPGWDKTRCYKKCQLTACLIFRFNSRVVVFLNSFSSQTLSYSSDLLFPYEPKRNLRSSERALTCPGSRGDETVVRTPRGK